MHESFDGLFWKMWSCINLQSWVIFLCLQNINIMIIWVLKIFTYFVQKSLWFRKTLVFYIFVYILACKIWHWASLLSIHGGCKDLHWWCESSLEAAGKEKSWCEGGQSRPEAVVGIVYDSASASAWRVSPALCVGLHLHWDACLEVLWYLNAENVHLRQWIVQSLS